MALASTTRAYRVVLADDHTLLRAGLRLLIEEQPEFEVVGETGDGRAVEELIRETGADALVLDLEIPGADSLRLLERLADADRRVRLLALAERADPVALLEAVQAGASAALSKSRSGRSLTDALRAVRAGIRWLDPALESDLARRGADAASLRRQEPSARRDAWDALTPRERDVAELVAEGLRYATVGDRLGISEHTVRNHLRRIFAKLGVNSRLELAVRRREPAAGKPV